MTDTTTTPPADTGDPAPEGTPDPDTGPEVANDTEDGGANREAAKYRRQLRDSQAQVTALTEALAGYRRQEVEALAGEILSVGADLLDLGTTKVGEFYSADGVLDKEAVAAAAKAIAASHPRLSKPPSTEPLNWGNASGNATGMPPATSTTSWANVIQRK